MKMTLRLQEQEGIDVSENVKTKLNGSSFNFLLDIACTAVHTTGPKKLKIIFFFLKCATLQERFIHVSWNLMVGYAFIQKNLPNLLNLSVHEAPDHIYVPKGKITR